jgi:mannitol/fructose-specific phosphotransferase system IIA component (Ntr-type)
MNLSDLLNERTICCPLVSNNRNDAIQELLNCLQNLGYLSSTIKLYSYIEELEDDHSTAAGKGVAYPHSTSIEVDDLLCVLGISKSGIDFNSPDNQLCHIILLSISADSEPDKHRKFITLFNSMISDSNIRTQFLDSANSIEGANIIASWEQEQLLADDLE